MTASPVTTTTTSSAPNWAATRQASAESGAGSSRAEYRFAYVRAGDKLAEPLLRDLEREYDSRYGIEVLGEPGAAEINRYPESAFAEPDGAFLVLLEDGVPVSGGAFFRLDDTTAEFKRIWTRADRRGRGLARLVLTELEHEARRLGYERVYLTTGPRQPEAVALYRGHGYTPLFDVTKPAAEVGVHPFEKSLAGREPQPRGTLIDVNDRTTVRERDVVAAPEPVKSSGSASQRERESEPERSAPVARTVVRLKHWPRWILGALAVFVLAQLVWTFFSNPQWRWPVFAEYFFNEAVLRGIWLTLWLTAVSAVIGFVLGAILALARLSGSPLLNSFAWGFIWFFRSVPLIVQLVLWYNLGYLFPTLGIGWPFTYDFWLIEFSTVQLISATTAAILGLSLHQAAYSAEIIRGGLLSVDPGQIEAAKALGIPRSRRFFRIVLPQSARAILPNAFNEVIGLLKGTSVVFILALPELFYTVQVIYNRNQLVVPLLLVATVWYTIFTSVLSVAQYYIERRFARGTSRELPPTPLQRLRRTLRRFLSPGDEASTRRGDPRSPLPESAVAAITAHQH